MPNELERLEQLAAEKRTELAELENAIRVLRKHLGLSKDAPASEANRGPVSDELAGMGGRQAAHVILTEAGAQGMHYRDLADAAISRGYRGAGNENLKATRDAFRRLCGKYPQEFEALGGGRYRIKRKR